MTSEPTTGRRVPGAAVVAAARPPSLPEAGSAAPLPPPPRGRGETATRARPGRCGRARVVPPSPPASASGGSTLAGGHHGAPRTWVLEFPAGMELLTANNRLSRYPKARVTKALREQGWGAAMRHRLPRIECATIHVTYLPPPRRRKDRHPFASERIEDSENLAPTGKHLVDGIVDAGVFASDSRKHVRRVTCELLPGSCPRGQVTLHITEVAP